MKVAVCLYGYLREWFEESVDSLLNALDENEDVDFHFFFHTWIESEDQRDLIREKIEEKMIGQKIQFVIDEQVQFDAREIKEFNFKSKFYSKKKVVQSCTNHETATGYKYDFVLLTRPDLAWFKKIKFSDLEKNKMYVAGPHREEKVNDLFFIGNSNYMERFCQLYDVI